MREYAPRQFTSKQQALSTDSAEVLSETPTRTRALIRNTDADNSAFLGPTSSVTTSNGFEVPPEDSVSVYTTVAIHAVADSGTPTIHVIEEFS